eukprot:1161540-Pelagomonas_calceolata.AAC.7
MAPPALASTSGTTTRAAPGHTMHHNIITLAHTGLLAEAGPPPLLGVFEPPFEAPAPAAAPAGAHVHKCVCMCAGAHSRTDIANTW